MIDAPEHAAYVKRMITGEPTREALLAFVEQMARMTTPEDEFAADDEEGEELRGNYEDADDYRADLDDDRLCGEFDAFMQMIAQARNLLA